MNSGGIINTRYTKTAIFGFLMLCMVIGTFADYQISRALYNPKSIFGIVFAAYGEYPATLGMIISGVLMMRSVQNGVFGVLKKIGCILLIAIGCLMACFMPTLYLSVSDVIVYAIGAAASLAAVIATVKISSKADAEKCVRTGLILFLVIIIEMVLINLVKIPWGRARMRLVAVNSEAYFMPWWQVGDGLKQQLTALGVAAEEFKSFPSGHAGNAAVILLLPLAANLIPSLKSQEKTLLVIAEVWVILVALSRIIMGAHYLTDVIVGATITYCVILLVLKLTGHRNCHE